MTLIALAMAAGQSLVESRTTTADGPIDTRPLVSFELDVLPILTAKGCNAGACHGKQNGQNGFQLSLLGFDADFDHSAIASNGRGRRLTLSAPDASLLLQKATAEKPHGGGRKIELNSDEYETLQKWIAEGATRRVDGEPTLDRVELATIDFSLQPNESRSLRVVAHYSNGAQRDVTQLTSYLSNHDAIVSVSPTGVLKAGPLPGETAVMARFMNHICVANVSIPRSEALPEGYFDELPRNNFVDELVYAKLAKLGIKPSAPASDHTFLRRAYSDVIGRLPSPDEARDFLDSSLQNKRELLVDRLLDDREYVDHWANHWADLLRPNPYRVGIKAVLNYDNWIRQQFRDNVPYDEFARRIVTAKGSTWQNGAATLYRDRRSPDEVATMVSQLFLGVRLECAKCHHHPFERWSQHDFYSFAAYFGKVGRKGTGLSPPISGGEEIVYASSRGDVKHPVTGEVLAPKPLFGAGTSGTRDDPRETLAEWMTSTNNQYFAQVQVNRVWAQLMGRGFVEPVDDLRSTNPPSNPALLDALARHFQESDFDTKRLIKTILMSHTYALDSIPNDTNAGDRVNYSRHYRQRLRAEVLMDAVNDVTETTESMEAMAPDSRANQVWTHRIDSLFLDTFGRPNENQDPPCERVTDSSVTQTLHLMNSRELDSRVRKDNSRAGRLAKSELSSNEIVEELYLTIFSRRPSDQELQYAEKLITDAGDKRQQRIEDLMWAMMNSPEFSIQN